MKAARFSKAWFSELGRDFLKALLLCGLVIPVIVIADEVVTTHSSFDTSSGNVSLIQVNENVRVWLSAGRSYACTLRPRGRLGNAGFSTTVQGPSANISGILNGEITPPVSVGPFDTIPNDNRISVVAQEDGQHIFRVVIPLGYIATGVHGGDIPFNIQCLETTLYGAYNTNANDFNFLEIENTTTSTVTGSVTAYNWDSSPGSPIFSGLGFGITPSNRVDIILHDRVGPNKFGQIIVTHNGPYGALKGRVSQYRADGFLLTGMVPLTPRDLAP